MKAFIKAVSYYLPEKIITNQTLSQEFPEWDVNKIGLKTGISERSVTTENEFASDLGISAANILFDEYQIDRSKIDFLLYCTQSPDYFLPTTACIIQDKLNLNMGIGALDFNLGCSGYIYGLSIAKGLIFSGIAKNILLITSETYSKFIHPKDKSNRTIFGDGASATLISSTDGICEIGEFVLGTDGSGAENLIVKNNGIRNFKTVGEDKLDEYGNVRNPDYLYMNGPEIFNFTSEKIPILTKEILFKVDLKLQDIDLFIFHQANKYMLNHLRKKIGIDESRFQYAMEYCGNTVSSTIPIAIKEAQNQGKLDNARNVILEGFGVGYSWGACHLIFNS